MKHESNRKSSRRFENYATQVLLTLCLFVSSSCSTTKMEEPVSELLDFSIENLYKGKDQLGCKSMLDGYCSYLYSPAVLGNLRVRSSNGALLVLQGKTKNDFSAVYLEYAKAKIRNHQFLPADLLESLSNRNYFPRLKLYIGRRTREEMTLFERLRFTRIGYEVDSLWNAALEETVLKRMDSKLKGFHKIKEELIPVELAVDRRRIRRNLISEISRAVWRKHPNWKKVETNFESLRTHFTSMINRLDLPEQVRVKWLERIKSVKLVLPGSIPELSDRECATTKINAYYYPHLNMLTVCAGDFNSEDILETLAHEMGHALDIDRSRYIFQSNSDFGQTLSQLRSEVCQPKAFSCQFWSDFKTHFEKKLTGLREFQPELPEFQRCLKRRVTTKKIEESDIDRLAGTIVSEKLSELAESNVFLRITKEKVRLPNGKLTTNVHYLNPCAYNLWTLGEEPLDDELTTLLFFTAEYRCSQAEPSSANRLGNAIEKAKDMSLKITKEVIKNEGEFSSRHLLETEGFASSPSERFADVLGSYALAEYLEGLSSAWDRRNTFLASSSWQCNKPSLETDYPEESNIQRKYVYDAHTEGDERKKELLNHRIQEVIGCKKDFEFNSCELDFR